LAKHQGTRREFPLQPVLCEPEVFRVRQPFQRADMAQSRDDLFHGGRFEDWKRFDLLLDFWGSLHNGRSGFLRLNRDCISVWRSARNVEWECPTQSYTQRWGIRFSGLMKFVSL